MHACITGFLEVVAACHSCFGVCSVPLFSNGWDLVFMCVHIYPDSVDLIAQLLKACISVSLDDKRFGWHKYCG